MKFGQKRVRRAEGKEWRKSRKKSCLSEVGFEPTPGEPDCDLNAAP